MPTAASGESREVEALRREVNELRHDNTRLKERVEELESTFARFFK